MLRAMDPSALDTFRAFRTSLYNCLHRRADALFELTDAILTAEAVPSPVHLSLQPSHRRGWGNLYDALSRGRIDAQALRRLLAGHPLAGSQTPVYAVERLSEKPPTHLQHSLRATKKRGFLGPFRPPNSGHSHARSVARTPFQPSFTA